MRKVHCKNEKVITWPDFFASDYVYRPDVLENISAYEFVMWYEKKTIKETKNGDDKDTEGKRKSTYKFHKDHPGHKFAYLQRRKYMVLPRILYKKGDCPDLNI